MAGGVQQLANEEARLVEALRRKDPDAIKLILQQQNRRLYRIARSILRDDSEAEDALQEAYVHAFSNLDGFRGDARFGTWLARIVMNEALGRLRRRRPTLELSAVVEGAVAAQIIPFPNANPQLDPETIMARREIHVLLEHAIDRLPEAFRTVLVARLIEGMSIDETAALFGILPETVKTRLHRARRLLKHEMEKYIGPVLGNAFPFAGRRCERLTENVLERLGLN
ncbi:RNA polymerase sigma-70 factor, ECF subfamily [Rhizobiales bacterium GAS191]|jgi:RNA polymerase sigma-70 factor (ECF subfamily)|nr:RNA polymerase sigma-70 factor, ECF subfamily [Rhizobiales bacterium GAS113]SEE22059.1 RNA polymerase sigma-70 factor, ECF subfamily [Rhizobiales bacterium GAS191]SEE34165.1 RNA polymerase sigma-70 factor, ECF subfamily [Rhizobiales bacterium GAS188]